MVELAKELSQIFFHPPALQVSPYAMPSPPLPVATI
jgi:hypothetical protein